MKHERRRDHETLRQIAERVATSLHADLKARKIDRINIDVIRAALMSDVGKPRDRIEADLLEKLTTRRVVEKTV